MVLKLIKRLRSRRKNIILAKQAKAEELNATNREMIIEERKAITGSRVPTMIVLDSNYKGNPTYI